MSTDSTVKRLEKGLYELNDIIRKRDEHIKGKYGVSRVELGIIQYVITEGKKKMKEVGEHFHIKLSTLTSVVDKLERKRMLKRVNSKEDRRVVYLVATNKGKDLHEKYIRYLSAISHLVEDAMDQAAFDAFVAGLEKMSRIELEEGEKVL